MLMMRHMGIGPDCLVYIPDDHPRSQSAPKDSSILLGEAEKKVNNRRHATVTDYRGRQQAPRRKLR